MSIKSERSSREFEGKDAEKLAVLYSFPSMPVPRQRAAL